MSPDGDLTKTFLFSDNGKHSHARSGSMKAVDYYHILDVAAVLDPPLLTTIFVSGLLMIQSRVILRKPSELFLKI